MGYFATWGQKRVDDSPYGIDVIIIEPGIIATEWGTIAADNLRKTSGNGPYADSAKKAADAMAKMYSSKQPSLPKAIGETILKAITAHKPKTRYAAGAMASAVLFLRKTLSDRSFEKLLSSMGGS